MLLLFWNGNSGTENEICKGKNEKKNETFTLENKCWSFSSGNRLVALHIPNQLNEKDGKKVNLKQTKKWSEWTSEEVIKLASLSDWIGSNGIWN